MCCVCVCCTENLVPEICQCKEEKEQSCVKEREERREKGTVSERQRKNNERLIGRVNIWRHCLGSGNFLVEVALFTD